MGGSESHLSLVISLAVVISSTYTNIYTYMVNESRQQSNPMAQYNSNGGARTPRDRPIDRYHSNSLASYST